MKEQLVFQRAFKEFQLIVNMYLSLLTISQGQQITVVAVANKVSVLFKILSLISIAYNAGTLTSISFGIHRIAS